MQSDRNGKPPALWKVLVLCLVSALGNLLLNTLVPSLQITLFLDTVFTIAVTMSAGILAGMGTGVVAYPLLYTLYAYYLRGIQPGIILAGALFIPCTVVEILLVCLFRAKIERSQTLWPRRSFDSFFGTAVPLMLLIALDCVAVSVTGGLIDFALFKFSGGAANYNNNVIGIDDFKLGLLRANLPFLAAAILVRIPINIVDRFIAVSGGYGVSLLYRRFLRSRERRGCWTLVL